MSFVRKLLSLCSQSVVVLFQATLQLMYLLKEIVSSVYTNTLILRILLTTLILLIGCYYFIEIPERILYITGWYAWWVWLGILSSIGLGCGLHTFVLYLGPHVAQVTLSAYECGSLNFARPPYPYEIFCPEERSVVTIWKLCMFVKLETFLWGLGTAIGELPPYFIARASSMSGVRDEEFSRLEQLEGSDVSFTDRIRVTLYWLVMKLGFWGILACASIPNPLYDLAGVMCGHFHVPFWRFFSATLIGKGLIKAQMQVFVLIVLFSEHHVIACLSYLPYVGQYLERALISHKMSLHNSVQNKTSTLSVLVTTVVSVYFACSISWSLAQAYRRRISN